MLFEAILAGLISSLIIAILFKFVFIPNIEKVFNSNQKGTIKITFMILHTMYFKRQERKTPFHPNDFLRIIQHLTARDTMLDYLSVEKNYSIGEIEHPTKYDGLVPQDVRVQALTTLNIARSTINRISYFTEKIIS